LTAAFNPYIPEERIEILKICVRLYHKGQASMATNRGVSTTTRNWFYSRIYVFIRGILDDKTLYSSRARLREKIYFSE